MANVNDIEWGRLDVLPNDIKQQYVIEQLQKEIRCLTKELGLYRKYYSRPIIIKEIIHHPARPRDSICLYGIAAYEEIVYE